MKAIIVYEVATILREERRARAIRAIREYVTAVPLLILRMKILIGSCHLRKHSQQTYNSFFRHAILHREVYLSLQNISNVV